MGAGASSDADQDKYLTKEEALEFAGAQWDEAKWEAAEKDAEGRVKLVTVLSLAEASAAAELSVEASAEAPAEAANDAPDGAAMVAADPTPAAAPAKKKHLSMRDRHKYRFPEYHEEHKEDLDNITVVHGLSEDGTTTGGTDEGGTVTTAIPTRKSGPETTTPAHMQKAELVFIKLAEKLNRDKDASANSSGFGTRYRKVTVNYYSLFKEMDLDNTGRLTKVEFRATLRRVLKISAEDVSDEDLDQIYDAMDSDGDGSVSLAEFAAFERGAQATIEYRAEQMYHSKGDASADIGSPANKAENEALLYYGANDRPEDLTSVPELSDVSTRAGSLAADRVENAPKDLDEAHLVLWHLTQHIAAKTEKEQTTGMVYHPGHVSLTRMFKSLDLDQSGSITRDEWAIHLRKHIGIGTNITDDHLNFLFDAMDDDRSGGVTLVEFCAWAKGASSAAAARGLAAHVHYSKSQMAEMAAIQEKTLGNLANVDS